ncbi:MAG TPA: NAD(P)/FAD-dependent oxidoreductase [Steroidobacteraceae bacterium]|jgi:thioredoxin reductase (NADPH)|nr:NAD(P)/FAD-dependent oxidoreductase [Steroidobacteraceae bacterium]
MPDAPEGDPAPSVAIIGAGPCGLFQVFELGLLGIQAHVFDSLKVVGGQCAELYPDKPIYDIPALPVCAAQELVDRLMQQIHPFKPQFHLGAEVTTLLPDGAGRFKVGTAGGTEITVGAVVIAAGLGAFQPRRLGVPGTEAFEGRQIHYRVRDAQQLAGQRLLVFGGGDSALDWAVALAPVARSVTLVHRREHFRGAPATVTRLRELQAAGSIQHIEGIAEALLHDGNALHGVRIKGNDGIAHEVHADQILVFFGLHPKLGPIAQWGLALERKALAVDTEQFQTSVPGIFAVGDINTYPGKKKLILSGFHEAALAAFGIQHYLFPQKKQFLQYTTTSPIMHKRLGVPD